MAAAFADAAARQFHVCEFAENEQFSNTEVRNLLFFMLSFFSLRNVVSVCRLNETSPINY